MLMQNNVLINGKEKQRFTTGSAKSCTFLPPVVRNNVLTNGSLLSSTLAGICRYVNWRRVYILMIGCGKRRFVDRAEVADADRWKCEILRRHDADDHVLGIGEILASESVHVVRQTG